MNNAPDQSTILQEIAWIQEKINTSFTDELQLIWVETSEQSSAYSLLKQQIETSQAAFEYMYLSFQHMELELFGCFFPMLKRLYTSRYQSNEIPTVLDRLHVYPAHIPLFIQYFYDKTASRDFELLIDEMKYERKELMNAIYVMLQHIFADKRTVLFVDHCELMREQSIELMKFWMKKSFNQPNFAIIFRFDSEFVSHVFAPFSRMLRETGQLLTFDAGQLSSIQPPSKDRVVFLNNLSMVQLSANATTLFHFFHYEETIQLITDSFKSNIHVNPKMHMMFADSLMFSNEIDRALNEYKKMLEMESFQFSDAQQSMIHRKMSICFYMKDLIPDASKHIALSLRFAELSGDDHSIMMAQYQYLIVIDRDRSQSQTLRFKLFFDFEKIGNTLQAESLLAQYAFNFYLDHNVNLSKEKRLARCNQSIRLFKKHRNLLKLSLAYHFKANVISIFFGDHDRAFRILKQSEAINRTIDETAELIKIYNGMGYNFLTKGKYSEAIYQFNKALDQLKMSRMFNEVAITLFNIGLAYFMAGLYKETIRYFEDIIKIMNTLNINEIPYHSQFGIHSLLGLCYWKNDQFIHALNHLRISRQFPKSPYEDEQFYGFMLQGVVASKNHQFELADQWFLLCEKLLEFPHTKMLQPFYYSERAFLYTQQEQPFKYRELLQRAFSVSLELGYSFQSGVYQSLLNGETKLTSLKISAKRFDSDPIVMMAKQEKMNQLLHRKVSEIQFLNKIHLIFMDRHKLIVQIGQDLVRLIHSYFHFENISMLLCEDQSFELIYSDHPKWNLDIHEPVLTGWLRDVLNNTPHIAAGTEIQIGSENNLQTFRLFPLQKGTNLLGLLLMQATKNTDVKDEDEVRVLSIAATSISAAVETRLLEESNQSKQRQLNLVASRIKHLMDHADQGFLMFDDTLTVRSEFSHKCIELFGHDITGRLFVELIQLDEIDRAFFEDLVQRAMSERTIPGMKPAFLTLLEDSYKEFHVQGRVLTSEYKRISDPNDETQYLLMVVLTDITEQKQLEANYDKEKQNLNMIVKSMMFRHEILNLLQSYERFVQMIKDQTLVDPSAIKMHLHTLKGNFAQLGWSQTANEIHDLESQNVRTFLSPLFDWDNVIAAEIKILRDKLGQRFFDELDILEVDKKTLIQLSNKLIPPISNDSLHEISKKLVRLTFRPIQPIIQLYSEHIGELALRFQKQVQINCKYDFELLYDPQRYDGFLKSLIHIFRNSIDHGIEFPEERIEAGKDECGNIECTISHTAHQSISLTIRDDGKGVNIERLREKSRQFAIESRLGWEEPSDETILQMIFEQDISTKEHVTDISGRGIGLYAVKEEVEKLGGIIEVRSISGEGTTFYIEIPIIE